MSTSKKRCAGRRSRPGWTAWLAAALAVAAVVPVSRADAQRGGRRRGFGYEQYFAPVSPNDFYKPPAFAGNVPYDGRFTFARIEYRGSERWSGREGPGWSHDYPDAEEHFMRIMREVTSLDPFIARGPMLGGVIVALDDPLLFKYPVAYLSEPGGWHPTAKEQEGLRTYLQKGGFLIVDDFPYFSWGNFEQVMAQVLPGARLFQLTGREPIFDAFYKVDLSIIRSEYGGTPMYFGIYEDNDPNKRLLVIANYINDIGESWQWSGQGWFPVAESNEAYKLGVNYLIYALTH